MSKRPSISAGTAPQNTLPARSDDETVERLGPYIFIQKRTGHRLTSDSVLLADFLPPLKETDSVIDLGTGSGVIPLILSYKSPAKNIAGVEIDAGSASIAKRNVEANGLASRIKVLEMDFRELKTFYPEGAFNVVVSNPPYVKAGAGRVSPDKSRALARSEVAGVLSDLVDVSKYLAGEKGRIYYIFPVARLFEMLGEIRKAGLGVGRLKFIQTNPKKAAKLFLIESGRGLELKIEESVFYKC